MIHVLVKYDLRAMDNCTWNSIRWRELCEIFYLHHGK